MSLYLVCVLKLGLVNIKTLFGNIEQVREVSQKFLEALDKAIVDVPPTEVCVGKYLQVSRGS